MSYNERAMGGDLRRSLEDSLQEFIPAHLELYKVKVRRTQKILRKNRDGTSSFRIEEIEE